MFSHDNIILKFANVAVNGTNVNAVVGILVYHRGTLTYADYGISILGSSTFSETFHQISDVWENAQT